MSIFLLSSSVNCDTTGNDITEDDSEDFDDDLSDLTDEEETGSIVVDDVDCLSSWIDFVFLAKNKWND